MPEDLAEQIAGAAKELSEQNIPEIEKNAADAKADIGEALEEAKKSLEEAVGYISILWQGNEPMVSTASNRSCVSCF